MTFSGLPSGDFLQALIDVTDRLNRLPSWADGWQLAVQHPVLVKVSQGHDEGAFKALRFLGDRHWFYGEAGNSEARDFYQRALRLASDLGLGGEANMLDQILGNDLPDVHEQDRRLINNKGFDFGDI